MPDQASQQSSPANPTQGGASNETELTDLKERVARIEIGIVALSDDKFDADVYRKAMELVVREQLFGKILTILAVAGLVLGAGYAAFATQFLRGVAEEAVERHSGEISNLTTRAESAVLKAESAFLKTLLVDSLEGEFDSQAGNEILSSDTNRRVLSELLSKPEDRTSLRLAAHFALNAGDTALIDLLKETAGNPDVELSIRAEAIKALVAFNSEGRIKLLLSTLEGTSASGFDTELLEILSYETEVPAHAVDIMRGVLASDDDEAVEAAIRFFLVNPNAECDAACDSLIKRHANRQQQLVSLFQDVRAADLNTDRISRILENVRYLAEQSSFEQMTPIYETSSILLLQAGDRDLYNYAYDQGFTYRYEVWVDHVASLFEGFAQRNDLGDLHSITGATAQRAAQVLLWETEQAYRWDSEREPSGRYVWVDPLEIQFQYQQESLGLLQGGDFDGFLTIMSSGYYDENLWIDSVRPLFPDFEFDGEPGSFIVQDDLWRWVESNIDQLEWQNDAIRLVE